ncbi:MAG: hypothetical protein RLZZ241_2020 [Bacteroidota bacterium]|jgi:23S rRNA (pseudouridine1915-N3)-methyltransferase
MKLVLLSVGATDSPALKDLIHRFEARISRYIPFQMEYVPDVKITSGKDPAEFKSRESANILKRLQPQDVVWILDENGKMFSSRAFAQHIQKTMNAGPKRLVLIIGGAYGFDNAVRNRANDSISLSELTFNHQVVRLMAVEQIYRAFSILKGDPYHND